MIVKHLQIIFNRGSNSTFTILAITWYVNKRKNVKLYYNYSKTKLKNIFSNNCTPHEVIILSCSKITSCP